MTARSRPAVFLDRDGVLIEAMVRGRKPYAAVLPEQVKILSGVAEACTLLRDAGFILVMTTNQPDVARGKISRQFVEETNADLARGLGLDDVEVCLHDNADDCDCRKPKPGLMTQAAVKLGIDLTSSFVVGDRWRDVEAGRNAGCKTVLLDYGYDEALKGQPDHVTNSLLSAAGWIKAQKR